MGPGVKAQRFKVWGLLGFGVWCLRHNARGPRLEDLRFWGCEALGLRGHEGNWGEAVKGASLSQPP